MGTGSRIWWFKWDIYLNRLIYLNIQSQDGETVWERLGSMALLKEMCHWIWAHAIPRWHIFAFCLWMRYEFTATAPAPCLSVYLPLEPSTPKENFININSGKWATKQNNFLLARWPYQEKKNFQRAWLVYRKTFYFQNISLKSKNLFKVGTQWMFVKWINNVRTRHNPDEHTW